jgi:VWFA-related protein
MTRAPRFVWMAIFAALMSTVPAGQDAARPQIDILSPSSDAYLSGPTRLSALVNPPEAAARATFFVDGFEVCATDAPPFDCVWDAGRDVAAHQIRLVVDLEGGGRLVDTVRTRALTFADREYVDAIQVTVTVTDDEGNYIQKLPRGAFRLFEDGREQTIASFASEDVPLELAVAVDISGSMTTAMTRLKDAVKRFLGAIPSRDQVTLLGFNDTVFPLARRVLDPAERMRAVDRLAPWGATALYDVLVQGTNMLGQPGARKSLVVFTDGEDQGSRVSPDDAERRLQASDVTLYMIGQGRGVTHDYLRRIMTRLVTPTGGRMFSTDKIEALDDAFSDLLEELSNQYLLSYQPTNATRTDAWREIRVEVEGGYHVRARQGYRAIYTR